jgi:Zn-dependent protease
MFRRMRRNAGAAGLSWRIERGGLGDRLPPKGGNLPMQLTSDWRLARLGSLGGIPIHLNVSFLLVPFVLGSALPRDNPKLALPLLAAGIAGIFLSILLHELGHALAARRRGLGTSNITIGGFYGFAELAGPAYTARDANFILAAGPLSNLAIFLWLWALAGLPSLSEHLRFGEPTAWTFIQDYPAVLRVVRWLALLNLSMALFNLLPAFPLDGGRIYRNLLVPRLGYTRGVRLIAGLGLLVGVWAMLAGLATSFVVGLIGLQILAINLGILADPVTAPVD